MTPVDKRYILFWRNVNIVRAQEPKRDKTCATEEPSISSYYLLQVDNTSIYVNTYAYIHMYIYIYTYTHVYFYAS